MLGIWRRRDQCLICLHLSRRVIEVDDDKSILVSLVYYHSRAVPMFDCHARNVGMATLTLVKIWARGSLSANNRNCAVRGPVADPVISTDFHPIKPQCVHNDGK